MTGLARRVGVATVVVAAAVVLAGCGVRLDAVPQPVPPGALPAPSLSATVTVPAPGAQTQTVRLWFVRDDGLVPVLSDFAAASGTPGVSPAELVAGLTSGPDRIQAAEGLRTVVRDPLTELPLVAVPVADSELVDQTVTEPGSVVVVIAPEVAALPPGEQVLLLGQVVLSITGAGYPSVTFVDSVGSRAAVPLPGGRLLDRPAVARDYAGLIIEL